MAILFVSILEWDWDLYGHLGFGLGLLKCIDMHNMRIYGLYIMKLLQYFLDLIIIDSNKFDISHYLVKHTCLELQNY